jgi:rRNA maturation RNase YbeY
VAAARLKKFIPYLLKKEGKKFSQLNFIFCDDPYLLEVNRTYLKHNYFTDIITFPLNEKGEPIVADIYISTDRVYDNCRTYGSTFQEELRRVVIHGLLHLCGYNDKSKKDREEMRKKENQYLNRYLLHISRGTI